MEENFTNILSDGVEILIDLLTENEILREIPVIGTSLNLIKGFQSIRDKIYLNKIEYFLKNVGELTSNQKQHLIEESKKDQKRRIKFGESLYTTIEQADSLIKIKYLSVSFEAFLNQDITNRELRHICHAINKCFIDDLVEIVEEEFPNHEVIKANIATGLATSIGGGNFTDLTRGSVLYSISTLGETFREIWKKHK